MAITRSRLWYTQMNFALPDTTTAQRTSQSFLWAYYRLLTTSLLGNNGPEGAPPAGSLWTVMGSSNGSIGAMDGVDRWGGGTFSASNFVRAPPGTIHSWIVLKSPNALGPIYMCIDYSTLNDGRAKWYLSTTNFVGGTQFDRPTSTNESQLIYNGSGEGILAELAQGAKIHMCRNSDGGFYFLSSYDGTGQFFIMHMVQKLADAKAGDLAPFFQYYTTNTSAPGIGETTSYYQGNFAQYGRNLLNTAQSFNQFVGYLTGGLANANTNTNNSPNTDGTLDAVPMYSAWLNASQTGLRGRVEDMYTLWQKVSPGTMIASVSPFTFTAFNNTVLPFSVAPSL